MYNYLQRQNKKKENKISVNYKHQLWGDLPNTLNVVWVLFYLTYICFVYGCGGWVYAKKKKLYYQQPLHATLI